MMKSKFYFLTLITVSFSLQYCNYQKNSNDNNETKINIDSSSLSKLKYSLRIDFMTLDSVWLFNNIDSFSKNMSLLFPDYNSDYYKNVMTKAYYEKQRYFLLKRNISHEKLEDFKSLSFFSNNKLRHGFIVEKNTIKDTSK